MRKPTKQQEEFIAAFIETRNATEAARRAGYKHPEVRGAEQLQKPHVRAKIDAIDARAADELVLTDKWIIERLMIEAVGETDAPVPEDSE
ncbi:MAG: terminase small subunit, partial [Planctomycetota bacterium]